MANIKNLAMADEIVNNKNITFKKGFMGFGSKAIYTPTASEVKVYIKLYNADDGNAFLQLIDCKESELKEKAKSLPHLVNRSIGNFRVEAAISEDHQFVAVHVLRYADFRHCPIRDVKLFEGENANMIAEILKR